MSLHYKTTSHNNNEFHHHEFHFIVPMGSPMSSLLAEIFLQHLKDTKILNTTNMKKKSSTGIAM
jgi:hypothetical protein